MGEKVVAVADGGKAIIGLMESLLKDHQSFLMSTLHPGKVFFEVLFLFSVMVR